MPAVRRVYRAVVEYEDPRLDTTRDFLTKRSRDAWAKQRREGYPADNGGLLDDYREAIPPAREVRVYDSQPVTF